MAPHQLAPALALASPILQADESIVTDHLGPDAFQLVANTGKVSRFKVASIYIHDE